MEFNNDEYKDVPHNGKFFTENGITYYWNFSNAELGTQLKTKQTAWASTGPLTETPLPGFSPNSTPVIPAAIQNPGFYYEIDGCITAVESRVINGSRITKWRVEFPLDGATQQALAWSSRSKEEYQAKKQAASKALRAA